MFWGLSESIDIWEEYKNVINQNADELNILLFGTGDPRNILFTIAKSYKHSTKLNFFVIDGCAEIVARNMLLLLLALEGPDMLSLRNKTHLYMDIYGNTLLRPFSNSYVSSKADVLRKIITDEDEKHRIVPVFDIGYLKYRERDNLETAFLFWLPKEGHIFNITQYWEKRLRQLLGVRYDHREGVFDWDLTMNLKESGAAQIASQEYRYWRDTGIAFTFPEYEQCQPNKTMVAGLIKNGLKFCHRGYIGDQETGPFCCHGLVCPENEMLKESYGKRDYRATDISERNLYEIFYEIQNKKQYVFDKTHSHKLGANILLLNKPLSSVQDSGLTLKQFNDPSLTLENTKIYFLSADFLTNLTLNGTKFHKFYDVAFIAHNYFPLLSAELKTVLKDESLILFETKQYTLLRQENKSQFLTSIKNFAKEINLKNVTNFNVNLNYSIVKYKTEK